MKLLARIFCLPCDWIELFRGEDGWHYRIRSEQNGNKLSTSERYSSKAEARDQAAIQADRHGYKLREVDK